MYRTLIAIAIVCATVCSSARADVFLLANGGRVTGKLLNPDESPRKIYVVQPDGGGRLTLAGSEVDRVLVKSALEQRYEQVLPALADTEAAHWDMAEKCEKAGLREQRTFHLEQVLRHNPDREAARYALGYSRVEGRWQRQEDYMTAQGFIRHRGAWRVPQELVLEERERKNEQQIIDWKKKVKLWRTWIIKGRSKATQGQKNMRGIRDSRAASALAAVLKEEREPRELKQLYIEILGRFDTDRTALDALIWAALNDVDSRVREKALDELADSGSNRAVQAFIKTLDHNENKMVNRAAFGLGQMHDRQATLPLIDALITEHKRVVGGGGVQPGFGSDGSAGLSVGGKPKVIKQKFSNDPVLRALTGMYTGVNFRFDQEAWKKWYVDQNTPQNVNLRRSD